MVRLDVLGGTNQWSDVVSTTSGAVLLLLLCAGTKVVTHGLPSLASSKTVSSQTVVVFTLPVVACTVGPSMSRPRKVLVVGAAAAAAVVLVRTATPLGLGGTRPGFAAVIRREGDGRAWLLLLMVVLWK
jgi:hypothetical protein